MTDSDLEARVKWIEECLASAPEVKNEFSKVITVYQLKLKTMEQSMEGMRQKLRLLGALPSTATSPALTPSASDSSVFNTAGSAGTPMSKLASSQPSLPRSPRGQPTPVAPTPGPAPTLPAPGVYDVRFSSVAATSVGAPYTITEGAVNSSPDLGSSDLLRAGSATLRSPSSANSIATKSWRQSITPQAHLIVQANRSRTATVSASRGPAAYATLRGRQSIDAVSANHIVPPRSLEQDPFAPHINNPSARALYMKTAEKRAEAGQSAADSETPPPSISLGPPVLVRPPIDRPLPALPKSPAGGAAPEKRVLLRSNTIAVAGHHNVSPKRPLTFTDPSARPAPTQPKSPPSTTPPKLAHTVSFATAPSFSLAPVGFEETDLPPLTPRGSVSACDIFTDFANPPPPPSSEHDIGAMRPQSTLFEPQAVPIVALTTVAVPPPAADPTAGPTQRLEQPSSPQPTADPNSAVSSTAPAAAAVPEPQPEVSAAPDPSPVVPPATEISVGPIDPSQPSEQPVSPPPAASSATDSSPPSPIGVPTISVALTASGSAITPPHTPGTPPPSAAFPGSAAAASAATPPTSLDSSPSSRRLLLSSTSGGKVSNPVDDVLDELTDAAREGALQKADLEKLRKQEKLEALSHNTNMSNDEIRKLRKVNQWQKWFKRLQKGIRALSVPVNFRHLNYVAETYEMERIFLINKDNVETPPKRRLDEESKLDPALMKRIKLAKHTLSFELDVSGFNLTGLPLVLVDNFVKLRALDLSQNKFTAFPADLRLFDLLEELTLSHNIIPTIPPLINKIQRLRVLRIDSCNLGSLPVELAQLPYLEVIDASSNALQELPKWIGHMTELHYLDINRCPGITALPGELGHLKQLEYFDFSDCRVRKFPKEVCNLLELKVLRLANNHVEKIPKTVGQLTQLMELVLTNNKIIDLPVVVGNCANLGSDQAVFDITGNPMKTEILDAFTAKSRREFINFLQSKMKGQKVKTELVSIPKVPTIPKFVETKIAILDKFTLQEKMLCLGDWAVAVTEEYLKPALVVLSQQIKAISSPEDPILITTVLPKIKQMKIVWRRTEDFLQKLDRNFKLDVSKPMLEQIQAILLEELAIFDTTVRQVRDVIREKAMNERIEDVVAVVSVVHFLRDLMYIVNE